MDSLSFSADRGGAVDVDAGGVEVLSFFARRARGAGKKVSPCSCLPAVGVPVGEEMEYLCGKLSLRMVSTVGVPGVYGLY